MLSKRENYISWDEYFMGIALLSGQRSKDPSTPVGACIVDKKSNRILSVGYNGLPVGCSDDDFPWGREGDVLDTKYPYVVHAELNAILNNRSASFEGSKIYTTLFPCNECTKAIIQAGIKEIIYLSDKYAETDSVKASKRMLEQTDVKLRRFKSNLDKLTLSFHPEYTP
ncbi:MAG: deoxycytidylate deaminase [Caldicoprobacterales bacterium]|jgi:dCMP deaminase|nr:dCMP deaminase family protein [Clostridiales bacterium]